VAYQHVREPAAPPSDHDTDLPPEVDAIVMKALAKRVEDRYQSAAAMRSDIERYLAGRPVHAVIPPAPPTSVIPAADPETTAVRPPEQDDHERSRAGVWVLLGLLLAGLVAAAVWLGGQLFEDVPEQSRVPNLIGLTEDEARAEIGEAGLAVGAISFRPDPDAKRDTVVEQDPNRDQYVDPGTEVDFVLSSGKPTVEVPYVIGQLRREAGDTLSDRGLKPRFEERESDEPAGQVLATDPAPGESVPEGSDVTVFYSDGPEEVPDVVGLQQEEAEQLLRDAGFEPRVVETTDTDAPEGEVVQQSPEGGEDASEGSPVTIVVSAAQEEEPTEEPSPTETPTETPGFPTESPSPGQRTLAPGREL
jgi:serine/threonine-protein kinase